MPATIAGRLFNSKKAANAEYARIRDGDIHTEADRQFLTHIALGHTKIGEWLSAHGGDIINVYIGNGVGEWGSRCVHVEMQGIDDAMEDMTIGPQACLDGHFGIRGCKTPEMVSANYHRLKRNQLAREATNGQRDAYLNKQPQDMDGRYTCAGCGEQVARSCLDVDHKVLLENILRDFDLYHPGATFKDADPLMPKWLHFHRDKCVWQILCRDKCHRGTIAAGGKTAAETSARAKQKRKRDQPRFA